jgi:ubiquitin-conjugating enzyme E2 N
MHDIISINIMSGIPNRIIKEIDRLNKNSPPGMSIVVDKDNIRYIKIALNGPDGSPYQGGVFKLEMYLGESYPMQPPKVRYLTKIYHPNVDKIGRICLDILKDKWTPALQIQSVLLSLQVLMGNPNVDDPLDEQVASHWRANRKDAEKQAKLWTQQYAK